MNNLLARSDWAAKATIPGSNAGPLVKLYSAEIVRAADTPDGGRVRSFVITTGNPDRERDVVNPDGWVLDNYRKNPVVLFGHDYRSLPVGKCPHMRQDGGRWIGDVEFPPAGVYAFADTVLGLVDFGALNAVSVGFDPMEWTYDEERGGYNFIRQELLEFSIVPVPANAEALMLSIKGLGAKAFAPYKGWVLDAVEHLKAAGELSAPSPEAAMVQIPAESHAVKAGEALDIHPWGKKAGCCADAAAAAPETATRAAEAAPEVLLEIDPEEIRTAFAPPVDIAAEFKTWLTEHAPGMIEAALDAEIRKHTGRLD